MAVQSDLASQQPGRRLQYGETINDILDQKNSNQNGVTATGTTLAGAYAIVAGQTEFSTVGSGAGCALWSALTLQKTKSPTNSINNILGKKVFIWNDGANPLKVYAPDGSTIDGTAGATGVTLTNGSACQYTAIAVNTATGAVTWKSNKLGAVSS